MLNYFRKYYFLQTVSKKIFTIIFINIVIFICVKCHHENENFIGLMHLIDPEPPVVWDGECSQTSSQCPSSLQKNQPLLIISLDGFRAEYLTRGLSPTLNKIAECGVKADFMYPIYPSKTFPNHYSIVTGLYPSSHGIIDNYIYDKEMRSTFKSGRETVNDPRWYQKEPIWVTAQKQGKSSAAFFWLGSDVAINGSLPNNYRTYNRSVPFEERVDQVLKWLSSKQPPDFVTLYFEQPDYAAHQFGVKSQEVNGAIVRVNNMLSKLLVGLQDGNLINCVNIIVVSDHGMTQLSCNQLIDVRRYINTSSIYSRFGAFGRINPIKNSTTVDDLLSNLQCKNKHLRAYRKEDQPIRKHYVENKRIEPIILDIDTGYFLIDKDLSLSSKPLRCKGGNHGYDNLFPDMRAIFFAYGPAFKENITIPSFLNIELYELMCEVIGINPQPNNGTKGSLHEILKSPSVLLPQNFSFSPPVAVAPEDGQLFRDRINSSNCSCSLVPQPAIASMKIDNATTIDNITTSDNYTTDNTTAIINGTAIHLPFGIPHSPEVNDALVLLYNSDYLVAYDSEQNYPRWASFTITRRKSSFDTVMCWSGDARVGNAVCLPAHDGLIQRPLYSPGFSDLSNQKEAFFITNSIHKSVNHTDFLEEEMYKFIERQAVEKGHLNVVMGPVFNPFSYDGKMILSSNSHPVPTHIFIVLTWCSTTIDVLGDCEPKHLDVHSFLLPNFPDLKNCQTADAIIKENVARVADVEKVTGISFYTNLPTYQAIRLRTSVSHFSF